MDEPHLQDELARLLDLESLADVLSLAARPRFAVLACDTPRVTHAALRLTHERVEAARRERVSLSLYDPYGAFPVALDRALPPEELAQWTLTHLLDALQPGALQVLDLSCALKADQEPWTFVFHRMNERRNLLARALHGALILCLPSWLRTVFAHEAPDFWSIRSASANITIPPPHGVRIEILRELRSPADTWVPPTVFHPPGDWLEESWYEPSWRSLADRDLDRAFEELAGGRPHLALRAAADARHHIEERKQQGFNADVVETRFRVCLAAALCELGRSDEALSALAPLLKLTPAHALVPAGIILTASGHLTAAIPLLEQALAHARDLRRHDPSRSEWLRLLVSRGAALVDAYLLHGDLDRAEPLTEESLTLLRDHGARAYPGEDEERARLLAEGLLRQGLLAWARGRPTEAIDRCNEALAELRSHGSWTPLEWTRGLVHPASMRSAALHLANLGDLHDLRGDSARAELAHQESLEFCRRLASVNPDSLRDRAALAAALLRWIDLMERRADRSSTELLPLWNEARDLLRDLLAIAPDRDDWRRRLDACSVALARLRSPPA